MLALFETPAGYALFKVKVDTSSLALLTSSLEDPSLSKDVFSLKDFCKFESTADAVKSAAAVSEGILSEDLKSFLKEGIVKSKKYMEQVLAVSDPKLASSISKKFGIKCQADAVTNELMRSLREQFEGLVEGVTSKDINMMALGLSHSLSRHKIRFSADKVDTMIVQAISLLDDLDKELNTYAMRLKEWYGWHFPELARLVPENNEYAQVVKALGFRTNAPEVDLSAILSEELVPQVKQAADISMGTEISPFDLANIRALAEQVTSISEYRSELYEYLRNRMNLIAPNLTALVGELVGARLISHAGSLLNLAKHPSSTVQILGAEKALFRALKSKTNTPKYGLIFHASLVGQATPKQKGKISRVLAAKCSLAARCDAFTGNTYKSAILAKQAEEAALSAVASGEAAEQDPAGTPAEEDPEVESKRTNIGPLARAQVEARLARLEHTQKSAFGGVSKAPRDATTSKYDFSGKRTTVEYKADKVTASASASSAPASDAVEEGSEQEESAKPKKSKKSKKTKSPSSKSKKSTDSDDNDDE